ncbi:MAG: hypothetical protein EBU85_02340 [Actinobacteria bacterium]|nr:hypothetical protein [Actinomycetota bacterium]
MTVSKNRVNPEPPSNPGSPGRRYGGVDSDERQRQRHSRLIEAGLAVFGEHGYHLASVAVLDMFPMTGHVELLGVFRPGSQDCSGGCG